MRISLASQLVSQLVVEARAMGCILLQLASWSLARNPSLISTAADT